MLLSDIPKGNVCCLYRDKKGNRRVRSIAAYNTFAANIYEKLGFKSEGVRPGFYDDPKDDAVIYWKREEN